MTNEEKARVLLDALVLSIGGPRDFERVCLDDPDNLSVIAEALDAAEARGAAQERERVVAWLRDFVLHCPARNCDEEATARIANAIERGDHAQNGGGDATE